MSLATRLADFATAIGNKIKSIRASDGSLFLGEFTQATLPTRGASERALAWCSNWFPRSALLVEWDGSSWTPVQGDPIAEPLSIDDFENGGSETGEVGDLGWSFTNGTIVAVSAESNHPSNILRRSGATAAQVSALYLGPTTTNTRFLMSNWTEQQWIVAPETLSSDYDVRFGLMSDANNPPNHGIVIERLAADTNWFAYARASSVSSARVNLGAAFNTTWRNFRFVKAGNNVEVYLDNALVATLSSNLPLSTTGLIPMLQITPTTATARGVKVDYYHHRLKVNR